MNEVIYLLSIADNDDSGRVCLVGNAHVLPSPQWPVGFVELALVEDPEVLAQPICSRTVVNLQDVHILQLVLNIRLLRFIYKVQGTHW